MTSKLGRIFGFMLALAVVAFSLPASATFNNDYYKLVMSAGPVNAGPGQPVTATITNKARWDYLRSFTISAPPGVTITGVTSASSSIPQSKISFTSSKITVDPIQIAYNSSGALSITATFPALTTCGVNQLTWPSTAKGGLFVNWEVFTLSADSSVKTGLTGLGSLSLQFVDPPVTVNKDAAFAVTVKQASSCGTAVTLPPVSITLTGAPSFTVGTPQPALTTGGQAIITGNKFSQIGSASMNATTTAPGYASAAANLTVVTVAGTLGCENAPGPTNQFNGTPGGGGSAAVPAFFAGYRAADYKQPPNVCTPVSYSITNNIGGTGNVVDANGRNLAPNMTAINYAGSTTVGVLLAHTITFLPVWSNTQGLFNPARIKYCKGADCTVAANLAVAQGCLSPVVLVSSIPFIGTTQEPGCVRAWATEVLVPAAGDTCGGVVRPTSAGSANRACMLVSIDVLEKQDPPWGLTDE